MKMKNLYITISLFTMSFIYGQTTENSGFPFENDDITAGKVMAGMVALAVYFIPTIISRDKKSWKYIFIFNLLAAWTGIGWFIAFAWALNAKSKTFDNIEMNEETVAEDII